MHIQPWKFVWNDWFSMLDNFPWNKSTTCLHLDSNKDVSFGNNVIYKCCHYSTLIKIRPRIRKEVRMLKWSRSHKTHECAFKKITGNRHSLCHSRNKRLNIYILSSLIYRKIKKHNSRLISKAEYQCQALNFKILSRRTISYILAFSPYKTRILWILDVYYYKVYCQAAVDGCMHVET